MCKQKLFLWVWVILAVGVGCGPAVAGLAYPDPPDGGWTYMFDGDEADSAVTAALDGTWDHKSGSSGSDAWDGSGIGEIGPKPDGASPGGVSLLTDGATKYLRIQDTGRPDDNGGHGWDDPSNRKFTFAHSLGQDTGVSGGTILDDGVTLTFRARIPTDGPLDDEYPDDEAVRPWTPKGYDIHSDGLGCFGMKQGTGGDGMISFSLILSTADGDVDEDGLVMNSLNGSGVTSDIETGQGQLRQLTGFDPKE